MGCWSRFRNRAHTVCTIAPVAIFHLAIRPPACQARSRRAWRRELQDRGAKAWAKPRHSAAVAASAKSSTSEGSDRGSRPLMASLATPWTIDHASRAKGFGSPGGRTPSA